jgi:hypothetical protein
MDYGAGLNDFDIAKSISRAFGRGLGIENQDFSGHFAIWAKKVEIFRSSGTK